MPYIGKEPEHGNYQRIDTIVSSFNGNLTTFNLRADSVKVYPTSPATMIISLGGVIQEPNTSYTVTGDTITFTSAPATSTTFWGVSLGDTLDIGTPSDDSVTTAKIADDAVTADKLANSINTEIAANTAKTGITSGQASAITANTAKVTNATHTGDVTGATALTIAAGAVDMAMLATTSGTAGSSTFLRGDGQWQAAGGGSLTFIDSQTASNSTTLTVTGLSTTYDTYLIVLSDMVPQNRKKMRLYLGHSGGIDDGDTEYEHVTQQMTSTSANYLSFVDTAIGFIPLSNDVGETAADGEGLSAFLVLNNANSTTMHPTILGTVAYLTNASNIIGGTVLGQRKAVIAVTQVQVKFDTGYIVRGRMTVWGLAHA